jgi:PKD repeat protein
VKEKMTFATLQRSWKTVGLCVALALSACGGGGGGSSPAPAPPVNTAPSAPVVSVSPGTPAPNVNASFSASSTDAQGLAITYSWDFGDGSAAIAGATVIHKFSAPGSYKVKVTATNSANLATSTTQTLSVAYSAPSVPTITSSLPAAVTGQSITFTGASLDPNGLPLTYSWDFGDGSAATGPSVTHMYLAANSYTVKLTVADTAPLSSSATYTQVVAVNKDNNFVADCTGTNCGALNGTTYTGSGIGVWRYANTTASDATLNLNIAGVAAGKNVTLLFSNGSVSTASTVPNVGVLGERLGEYAPGLLAETNASLITQASAEDHAQDQHDAAHGNMLARQRAMTKQLIADKRSGKGGALSADQFTKPPVLLAAPAVGATRSWKDSFPTPAVSYNTTVQTTCSTGFGRNVVFWLDANALSSGKVTSANVAALANSFCGSTGSFARLTQLMGGDAWGPTNFPNLISDSPALLDINVVILDVPNNPGWAGYFDPVNTYKVTSQADSNEALAFFINANSVQSSLNFVTSTLIHEATHMINFYQRGVLRNNDHDTWLEETTAMMNEDILANAVFAGAYSKILGRTNSYLSTGGAVAYSVWPTLTSSGGNYNIGGAFGGYLNRRYGLSIAKQLVTSCADSGTAASSYSCLDSIIKSNGGTGYADDFARFGASIFARLPSTGQPLGYGYPAKTDGGYTLSAFSLTNPLPAPAALASGYTATTHTYQTDTVAAGKTAYVRNGVVVPANTSLIVVVQ